MTLNMEQELDVTFDFPYEELAKQVILASLDIEEFPYEAEVNLTLTDEATIHQINMEFREIDRSTDVLSFPMIDYEKAGQFEAIYDMDDVFNPDTGEAMLGDIVINVPRVFEQAQEYGHSVRREYAFLIAHSMLHLMGYDHMSPKEAEVMEAKQNDIMMKLNITRDM